MAQNMTSWKRHLFEGYHQCETQVREPGMAYLQGVPSVPTLSTGDNNITENDFWSFFLSLVVAVASC